MYSGILLVIVGTYIGVYIPYKKYGVGSKKGQLKTLDSIQKKMKWISQIAGMIIIVMGYSIIQSLL